MSDSSKFKSTNSGLKKDKSRSSKQERFKRGLSGDGTSPPIDMKAIMEGVERLNKFL